VEGRCHLGPPAIYRRLSAVLGRLPPVDTCRNCLRIGRPPGPAERKDRQAARIGVLLAWSCAMGFEQLAVLKQQFEKEKQAKRAQSKPVAKPAHKPASTHASKPSNSKPSDSRPSKPAAKPASTPVSKPVAKPQRPPRPAPRPAAPVAVRSKPVDPVVLTIGKLQKRFPKAFPKNPSPKVPLKIGIFEDLLAHATELALSETELRAAIKIWCRGSRYWTSMVEGAIRVDLSGEEGGRVSPEDGVRATKLEEGRLARVASKVAAPEKSVVPENAAVAENAAVPESAEATEKAAVPDSENVAD